MAREDLVGGGGFDMLWLPSPRSRPSTTLFPKFCSFPLIKLHHYRRWYFLLGGARARGSVHIKRWNAPGIYFPGTRVIAALVWDQTRCLSSGRLSCLPSGPGSIAVSFKQQPFIFCRVYFFYFCMQQIPMNTLVWVTAGRPFLAGSASLLWAELGFTKPIKIFCLCVVAPIYPSQLHICWRKKQHIKISVLFPCSY